MLFDNLLFCPDVLVAYICARSRIGKKLFFDSLFSYPELLRKKLTILLMRENRSRNGNVPNEKDPRKSGRGSGYENTKSDHVVVCAWLDSKMVLTVSNVIGKYPTGECQRYDRKCKKRITVPRPAIVET